MPLTLLAAGPMLAIELDRPAGPYHPGDMVHAAVTLHSEREAKIAGLRLGLLAWEEIIEEQEEGPPARRKTVDDWVAVQTVVDETTLAPGFHATYQVDLPIPADAFPPYDSPSLESGWLVKATVDRAFRRDATCELALPLVVPPPGVHAQPGEFGEGSEPETVDMKLRLPGLEWVVGATIEGGYRKED